MSEWRTDVENIPDGTWCWVTEGTDTWPAVRDRGRAGGWMNRDTWEDFYGEVTHFIPIEKPELPDKVKKVLDLDALLSVISGRHIRYLGKGLHTYPNGDEGNQCIFRGCLELEKQGLIGRKIDQPDYVLWMPVE